MELNNLKFILFFIIIFSSCQEDYSCIEKTEVQINRKLPSLDVIIFTVTDKKIINKLKSTEMDRVYFLKNEDTLDNIGYIRTKITSSQVLL